MHNISWAPKFARCCSCSNPTRRISAQGHTISSLSHFLSRSYIAESKSTKASCAPSTSPAIQSHNWPETCLSGRWVDWTLNWLDAYLAWHFDGLMLAWLRTCLAWHLFGLMRTWLDAYVASRALGLTSFSWTSICLDTYVLGVTLLVDRTSEFFYETSIDNDYLSHT